MWDHLPLHFRALADACDRPLYAVGGSVRDFLLGYPVGKSSDWDICSPMTEEELLSAAERNRFTVCAVYRNTGTVKLKDGDNVGYEFTRFRSDRYVRGTHTPAEITFTDEIETDARRRDFCANAVYYDVKNRKFVDPLGGIGDIRNRILRTVAPAQKVFGEDGLRLMRLSRFGAELGFSPDEDCLEGARNNARLILDIVPERIFAELDRILNADSKHGVPFAHYRGLELLLETGVLEYILPELYLGKNLPQRQDFHRYDVLEHSFRCTMYAPQNIRYAALLHDVGKPFCYGRDGNFYDHAVEGARIAGEILARLKAPTKLKERTAKLIFLHMKDYDCAMREAKVRRLFVEYGDLIDDLLALKQADHSACQDDASKAPTVSKWEAIRRRMKEENAPFTVKELALGGKDVIALGIPPQKTGEVLQKLLGEAALDGSLNTPARLKKRIERMKQKEEL